MKIPKNAAQIERLMIDLTRLMAPHINPKNKTQPKWPLWTMASVLATMCNADRALAGHSPEEVIAPDKLVDICTIRSARGPHDVSDRIFAALDSLNAPESGAVTADVYMVQALIAILTTIVARRSGDTELSVMIARSLHAFLESTLPEPGKEFMKLAACKP